MHLSDSKSTTAGFKQKVMELSWRFIRYIFCLIHIIKKSLRQSRFSSSSRLFHLAFHLLTPCLNSSNAVPVMSFTMFVTSSVRPSIIEWTMCWARNLSSFLISVSGSSWKRRFLNRRIRAYFQYWLGFPAGLSYVVAVLKLLEGHRESLLHCFELQLFVHLYM